MSEDGLTANVTLLDRAGNIKGHAIIDADDVDRVGRYRWSMDAGGYAVRRAASSDGGYTARMHRIILGLTRGDANEADHLNRNRLDNRKSNLRSICPNGNKQNTAGQPYRTSVYRGVYWDRVNQKWRAQVRVDGRTIPLGRFSTEEEAATVARQGRQHWLPYAID